MSTNVINVFCAPFKTLLSVTVANRFFIMEIIFWIVSITNEPAFPKILNTVLPKPIIILTKPVNTD